MSSALPLSQSSSRRLPAVDRVQKFLLPDSGVVYTANSAAPSTSRSTLRPSHQVPPLERAELKPFSTVARGTSNVLVPNRDVLEATNPSSSVATSLEDVWKCGMFGRAPQVAEFPPERFKSVDPATGKVCIVRYIPERFERFRIQRPELVEEFVEPETLRDDGARLMSPAVRRRIHELEVNGRQGEAHLREGLRLKSKLHRTCLFNFPHGALGIAESPYSSGSAATGEAATMAYRNAESLQQLDAVAKRRCRGGTAPQTSMADIIQGKPLEHPPTSRRELRLM